MIRLELPAGWQPRSLDTLTRKFPYLSPRERQVVWYYGKGYDVKEIAGALGLSMKTISTFLARAKRWLGISARRDFVALVHGLEPDAPVPTFADVP